MKDRDILLSFAKYFDSEYKSRGGTLDVAIGKTIISGDDAGKQVVEGSNFIRIDESNFFAEELDTTRTAIAQLYPIVIELFFKRTDIYDDEKSLVNDILLSGVTFPLYDFANSRSGEFVKYVRVDAQEVDGANPILVNYEYQHFYWYVKVLRIFG